MEEAKDILGNDIHIGDICVVENGAGGVEVLLCSHRAKLTMVFTTYAGGMKIIPTIGNPGYRYIRYNILSLKVLDLTKNPTFTKVPIN